MYASFIFILFSNVIYVVPQGTYGCLKTFRASNCFSVKMIDRVMYLFVLFCVFFPVWNLKMRLQYTSAELAQAIDIPPGLS